MKSSFVYQRTRNEARSTAQRTEAERSTERPSLAAGTDYRRPDRSVVKCAAVFGRAFDTGYGRDFRTIDIFEDRTARSGRPTGTQWRSAIAHSGTYMTPTSVQLGMGDPETGPIANGVDAHAAAAAAFIRRVQSRYHDEIAALHLFGSTARGDARGLASDADVLVIIKDDADREATTEGLRDVAYDIMLEYGPVVELHVLSEATFARYRHEGHPFVENVLSEGRSYA